MATIKQYQKKNGEKAWYFKTYLGIDPLTGKKDILQNEVLEHKKKQRLLLQDWKFWPETKN